MTDGSDLLATILAEPAEDLHRLKYADWLQEHGEDERAEFIRVGCEAVRWGCTFAQTKEQPGWKHNCGTNERGYWLCTTPRLREQELWDAHAHDWFPLLDKFKMGRTERGFVAELTCTAADWLTHAATIRAAHPIERLRLTTPIEVLTSDEPNEYRAPGCIFTLLTDARGFRPGEPRPAGRYLSSPATDVFLADCLAGLVHERDVRRAVFDRFWPGVEIEELTALHSFIADVPPTVAAAPPGPPPLTDDTTGRAAWNAVVGGILERMVVEAGLLPGGEDDDDESDD